MQTDPSHSASGANVGVHADVIAGGTARLGDRVALA
jgi:hypothetical protein